MNDRVTRALQQRLIMLREGINDEHTKGKYLVQGSTESTYTVSIGRFPKCTCPDHCYRKNRCKHIYFILLNVLVIPRHVATHTQRFALRDLKAYFEARLRRVNNYVERIDEKEDEEEKVIELDLDKIETQYGAKRKPITGMDCPICLESMDEAKENIIYCSKTCGNNMHTTCVERWSRHSGKWSCPLCRSDWDNDEEPSAKRRRVLMLDEEEDADYVPSDTEDEDSDDEEDSDEDDDY
jgi:hypothetical protein